MNRGMVKPVMVAAAVGMSIALGLSLMWRLANFDYIPMSSGTRDLLSAVSLFLVPPSLVLMEVGPREPITAEVATLYATAVIANGMVYAVIVLLGIGVFRMLKKAGGEHKKAS